MVYFVQIIMIIITLISAILPITNLLNMFKIRRTIIFTLISPFLLFTSGFSMRLSGVESIVDMGFPHRFQFPVHIPDFCFSLHDRSVEILEEELEFDGPAGNPMARKALPFNCPLNPGPLPFPCVAALPECEGSDL